MPMSDDRKLLLASFAGLAVGIYGLWLVINGASQGEAMSFSRYNHHWFTKQENTADFIVSILLHGALALLCIAGAIAGLAKYFFYWPPPKSVLSLLVGYVGATSILFFANYSLFALVGFPLLSILGLPVGWALSLLLWDSLGTMMDSKQEFIVLLNIGGFLGWWLTVTLVAYWRAKKHEAR